MDEEKSKEIKDEVIDRVTSDSKEAAEKLIEEAKNKPWYAKILYYVLALLAGGIYYIASVFGDDLWVKLQELLANIL